MRTVRAVALVAAQVAAITLAVAGCRSSRDEAPRGAAYETTDPLAYETPPKSPLRKEIREYKVVWTRGGKLGYLKTYDYSRGPDEPVTVHEVEDLDFRTLGWISDSGKGERFDYSADRVAAARRLPFERVELPVDTLENQVRRIFRLDPLAEIAMVPAREADLKR